MKKYYYSIGEVCNLLDLKPHILRYWEGEFRQLKPQRTSGKTRRYTPEQIDVIRTIKDLLYIQNFSIKGVKKRLSQFSSQEKYRQPMKIGTINEYRKQELIEELTKLKKILEDDSDSLGEE